MTVIKRYEEKYRADVQHICLETGPGDSFTDKRVGDYILSTYCNYYLDNEAENCFILVDEETDKAVGYILCCPDFKRFEKGIKKYFKSFSETGFENAMECRTELIAHKIFSPLYPAHLHINLNENYRNGGYGTKLIQTLLEELKAQEVKGISLICDYSNKSAIRFYRKNGFVTGFNMFFKGYLMVRKIK